MRSTYNAGTLEGQGQSRFSAAAFGFDSTSEEEAHSEAELTSPPGGATGRSVLRGLRHSKALTYILDGTETVLSAVVVCLLKSLLLLLHVVAASGRFMLPIKKLFAWLASALGLVGRSDNPVDLHPRPGDAVVKINALLCGLPRSGKSSLLYKMKLDAFIPTIPTVDTVEEEFDFLVGSQQHESMTLHIWDMGRRQSYAPAWQTVHSETDCVIFVIDSCDRKRLQEARTDVFEVMFEDFYRLIDCRFLIFANKQDVAGCMSRNEVESLLALPAEMRDRWRVVGSSSVTGQGVREGIRWLGLTSRYGRLMRDWDLSSSSPSNPTITTDPNTGKERSTRKRSNIEFVVIDPVSASSSENRSERHSSTWSQEIWTRANGAIPSSSSLDAHGTTSKRSSVASNLTDFLLSGDDNYRESWNKRREDPSPRDSLTDPRPHNRRNPLDDVADLEGQEAESYTGRRNLANGAVPTPLDKRRSTGQAVDNGPLTTAPLVPNSRRKTVEVSFGVIHGAGAHHHRQNGSSPRTLRVDHTLNHPRHPPAVNG